MIKLGWCGITLPYPVEFSSTHKLSVFSCYKYFLPSLQHSCYKRCSIYCQISRDARTVSQHILRVDVSSIAADMRKIGRSCSPANALLGVGQISTYLQENVSLIGCSTGNFIVWRCNNEHPRYRKQRSHHCILNFLC